MNWPLIIGVVLVVMVVMVGSQLGGSFMAGKAKARWVKQLYAVVLLAIAVKLVFQALGS